MDNKYIKNIIFDVGGVLIDYRWKEYIMEYGLTESEAEHSGLRLLEDPIWRDMDKGLVSEAEVIEYYIHSYPEDTDLIHYFFENAHNMILKRDNLYPQIEKLFDKGYNIYILSNYSERLFNLHTSHITFLNRCDGIVVSQYINMLKPEPEIYDYILDKYHLNPSECIFFDDNEENVCGAKKVGINSYCVKTEADLINHIINLL